MSPLYVVVFLILSAIVLIGVASGLEAAWSLYGKINTTLTAYKQNADTVVDEVFNSYILIVTALGVVAIAIFVYTAFKEPDTEL